MADKKTGSSISAREKAIALLARREHSARELKAKLERKGLDADESAHALADLRARDYQSDARFGEMLVRSRISGGYGPRWIIAELKTHGIGGDAAQVLIDAAEPDWPALIRDLLRRRYAGKHSVNLAERRKHVAFLLRRGFDAATVQSITRAQVLDASVGELD
ncbi:MAG: regulatory protein RecX [Rudaea sp.]